MANNTHEWEESNFEITRKRRKGFPSETQVKRGVRVVHGNKELSEKLGTTFPMRLRTQVLRTVAYAQVVTTAAERTIFFRE